MGRASLPGDLKARVLSATKQEPSLTRRAAGATDAIILAGTAAAVLNVFLAGGGIFAGQPHDHSYVSASWAAIASVTTWVAFGRGKSMLGRRRSVLVAVIASAVIASVGVVFLGSSLSGAISGSLPRAVLMGALTSTIVLAGFAYSRRGSEPRHPRAVGAALGAAAAAWAALLVELSQPQHGFSAALVAHLCPMLVAITLGHMLVGRVIVGRTR